MSDVKRKCFIITPVGEKTSSIRRHIDGIIAAAIDPILKENNFSVVVPHKMASPGSINKQIIQSIYDSDLVIANLTTLNANVMYELALRHCFGNPLIIIAEEDTRLPFDIINERTIFYLNDGAGVEELKKELKRCLSEIDFEDKRPKGFIYDALRDLEFEGRVIKSVETDNKENIGVFQLLLKRVDSLGEILDRNQLENRKSEIESIKMVSEISRIALENSKSALENSKIALKYINIKEENENQNSNNLSSHMLYKFQIYEKISKEKNNFRPKLGFYAYLFKKTTEGVQFPKQELFKIAKNTIEKVFKSYGIDVVSVVFKSQEIEIKINFSNEKNLSNIKADLDNIFPLIL